ncbi:hypothetical protein E2C01_026299 [Portunus trituberculatus]|uniref:Uncharacterized protein n=1 Tax=Portunus trituberculatus TaxID=210409 RepID=A0A5B7EFB4_PORTR|nr:hypothetical protein [Portunus trituberculatus]
MEATRYAVLKCVQRRYFPEELKALQWGQRLRKSPIRPLEPFLDAEGLIRVSGRLKRAGLQQDRLNPILLPKEISIVSNGRKARTSSCCRGTTTSSAPILCIIAGSCQSDI